MSGSMSVSSMGPPLLQCLPQLSGQWLIYIQSPAPSPPLLCPSPTFLPAHQASSQPPANTLNRCSHHHNQHQIHHQHQHYHEAQTPFYVHPSFPRIQSFPRSLELQIYQTFFLDLQSSQGSQFLMLIMCSKIHRSYNFAMLSNHALLRGTREKDLLRGAPETSGRYLKNIGCSLILAEF